jgi:hypothetical protein
MSKLHGIYRLRGEREDRNRRDERNSRRKTKGKLLLRVVILVSDGPLYKIILIRALISAEDRGNPTKSLRRHAYAQGKAFAIAAIVVDLHKSLALLLLLLLLIPPPTRQNVRSPLPPNALLLSSVRDGIPRHFYCTSL